MAICKSNTKNNLVMVKNLPEELSLEIRKFEVRLQEYVKAEEKAVNSLTTFIEKLKQLNSFMEASPTKKNSEKLDRIMELRLQAIKAFREALSCISKAEHEKSHLSESYGSILSALEEQIQNIIDNAEK
jgi:hypothetical protein